MFRTSSVGRAPRFTAGPSPIVPPPIDLGELLFSQASPHSGSPASVPIAERFSSLPRSEQERLRGRWGSANVDFLLNLGTETDRNLLCNDLLAWARTQESTHNAELALIAYQWILRQEGAPEAARRRAERALAPYRSEGPMGARAELFLRNTLRETLSPVNLLAMTGAGLAFRTSRLGFMALFSRFGLSETALSIAAAGAAFNVEALSFPLLHRAGRRLTGAPVDWNREDLGHDVLASYLFLGGMRAASFGATKFLRWGSATPGAHQMFAPNLGRLSAGQQATRMGAAFAGVMGGTYLESLAGLRHFHSSSDFFSHCLATFIQFQFAGRAAQGLLGPGFAQFERDLDLLALRWQSVSAPARLPALGALAASGGRYDPLPAVGTAMSENLSETQPGSNGHHGPMGGLFELPRPHLLVEPQSPVRVEPPPKTAPDSIPTIDEVAEALVRHQGRFREAAEALGLPPTEFEREMTDGNPYSEWSVFQTSYRGRMLFYRPALALARSTLGERVFRPESLQDLGLEAATSSFLQRMEVHSLWDLLLTTHGDMLRARQAGESEALISGYQAELTQKINARFTNSYGTVFENHPFEEGAVKFAIGRVFQDMPVRDLRLPADLEASLNRRDFQTVGDLMSRPIPTWVGREAIPEGSPLGTREARIDAVIRSLFTLLYSPPTRRLAEEVPPVWVVEAPREAPPAPPPLAFSEAELIRQLVQHRGDLSLFSARFSRTPKEISNYIQARDYDSELSLFQTHGKGTMLFYTPALRLAVSELGAGVHAPDSLARLQVPGETLASLRGMGVESFRDLLLLTRYDLERHLGPQGTSDLMEILSPQIDRVLGQSGLQRRHRPFREGVIKQAIEQRYEETPLGDLRLPPPTLSLLQSNGFHSVGDLMSAPIPQWIRLEQLEPGSHPAAKGDHIDATIRAIFALVHRG